MARFESGPEGRFSSIPERSLSASQGQGPHKSPRGPAHLHGTAPVVPAPQWDSGGGVSRRPGVRSAPEGFSTVHAQAPPIVPMLRILLSQACEKETERP